MHTLGVVLLLATLALAGCGAAVNSGFRNAAAPIASTTRFEAARFAGDWHVVSRIVAPDDPAGAAPERFAYEVAAGGFTVRRQWRDCAAETCADQNETTRAMLTGAGRYDM
ncbi:MAG TPA: hypothetical protein VLA45_20625, partial [Paracoccaceae bacterium]|nr:hypothetical protein [Paracoccaceae bacterium]